ncbi:MAG: hypothetical protein ACRCU3_02750 [Eubacteriaceae bacterium]
MAWLIENTIEFISTTIGSVLNLLSLVFLSIVGPDLTNFNAWFPEAALLHTIIQSLGIAILSVITIFNIFCVLLRPITESKQNLLKLILRFFVFVFLIVFGLEIITAVLDFLKGPFGLITEANSVSLSLENKGVVDFEELGNAIKTGVGSIKIDEMNIPHLPGPIESLFQAIFILLIGLNYIKLLFEILERYVYLGFISYTSPLAFSTGAADSSAGIFHTWVKLFISQLVLMFLNVWFLRIVNSTLALLIVNLTTLGTGGDLPMIGIGSGGIGSATLLMVVVLMFIKLALQADNLLSRLGLDAAPTGKGVGREILGGIMSVGLMASRAGSAFTGGRGGVVGALSNAMGGGPTLSEAGSLTAQTGGKANNLLVGSQAGNANKRLEQNKPNDIDRKVAMQQMNGPSRSTINPRASTAVLGMNAPGFLKQGSKVNSLVSGAGKMTGQMITKGGHATTFDISNKKPLSGAHQKIKLGDGSDGYVSFGNPNAIREKANFGIGSQGSSVAERTFDQRETKEALRTINGIDLNAYNGLTIRDDGRTLLGRADGTGIDELFPIGTVDGNYEGSVFEGEDSVLYGIQPYSGNTFSSITPDMVTENVDGIFNEDTQVVKSLNNDFSINGIPIEQAELHKDSDGIYDYADVTLSSGEMARIYDPAIIEPSKEFGTLSKTSGENQVAYYEISKDGSFTGTRVKSMKTAKNIEDTY